MHAYMFLYTQREENRRTQRREQTHTHQKERGVVTHITTATHAHTCTQEEQEQRTALSISAVIDVVSPTPAHRMLLVSCMDAWVYESMDNYTHTPERVDERRQDRGGQGFAGVHRHGTETF